VHVKVADVQPTSPLISAVAALFQIVTAYESMLSPLLAGAVQEISADVPTELLTIAVGAVGAVGTVNGVADEVASDSSLLDSDEPFDHRAIILNVYVVPLAKDAVPPAIGTYEVTTHDSLALPELSTQESVDPILFEP
jgi:hypothetical protein